MSSHFNTQQATNKDLRLYQQCVSEKEKNLVEITSSSGISRDTDIDLSHAVELYSIVIITMIIVGFVLGLTESHNKKNKLNKIFKSIVIMLLMGSSFFWFTILFFKLLFKLLKTIN